MSHASPSPDPANTQALDDARRLVVERNLAAAAFGHLTVDAFTDLPFPALGPTKALLKRFLGDRPWTDDDAEALAEVVGPGQGWWARPLDPEVMFEFGWREGRFAVSLSANAVPAGVARTPLPAPPAAADAEEDPFAATFDGPVVPEATPNPRTIRFRTGPLAGRAGETRWFESPASARGYWRAARLFDDFPEVANVLVGPDFVSVSLHRPADWQRLLGHVLAAVTEVFQSGDVEVPEPGRTPRPFSDPEGPRVATASGGRASRLAQAWAELGPLQPGNAGDLALVLQAARGDDPFRRQVAANLLLEADATVAAGEWERLLTDPSRSVRRATVDAMVDAGREDLRPRFERALGDADAWVRWKALRGLVELGAGPSEDAIAALTDDSDFRVRLEVAGALRRNDEG